MITFRQLEILAGIVKAGGFRRCADDLGITPEAVSANIRSLEAQLGYRLFERHAGGHPTLTSRGERAYRHASNILDDIAHLYGASGRAAPRRVIVGAHPFIMRYLQPGIDEFRAYHPDVTLELDLDGGIGLGFQEKVDRRMADLAYFFADTDADQGVSSLCSPVGREPLAIFVARDHPLAGKSGVSIADLSAVPVVHLSYRTALRPLIDRALLAYGLGDSPVALETDDYGLILTSVRRGRGYVCMFASAADEVMEANALAMLQLERPLPSLHIWRAVQDLRRGALITDLEAQLRKVFPA